ncbi:macro domain-containing protein [Alkalicoccus chagannorensis]|uniref:macro domain-containing protein n=1 Tax=Alkalicoccus chagannorensis TaxID=427072 RepID=UPI00041A3932|nr:macro domain-containing protein [Alkalicoccus chagannorensis]
MWKRNGKKMEVVYGDIADQKDIDAVVNAANAELQTGGGVAGAIHRAAGPALAEAGEKLAPIKPGEAVLTDGFNLPNDYVIHCLGPVYHRDSPADVLLASCYREALARAEEKQCTSIAFPAISTGAFGYPFQSAMRTAITTVMETVDKLEHVKLVRFVLFSEGEAEEYRLFLAED